MPPNSTVKSQLLLPITSFLSSIDRICGIPISQGIFMYTLAVV